MIEDSEYVDQDEIGTTEQSTENDVEEELVQENISCPVCSAEVGIGSSVCQVCGISL